jgi:hypothetical protein
MSKTGHDEPMELIVLLFILLVGPLAIFFGADSRIDEHRR